MKKYAGIGSRDTPILILNTMGNIASALAQKGYTLRSGGALGADKAFENNSTSSEIFYSKDATQEAIELALKYHPNPNALKSKGQYVLGLMGRNMNILLGKDLNDPVDFVICWTPNGEITGGTGQALRYCKEHNIKVYNLAIIEELEELREFYRGLR